MAFDLNMIKGVYEHMQKWAEDAPKAFGGPLMSTGILFLKLTKLYEKGKLFAELTAFGVAPKDASAHIVLTR